MTIRWRLWLGASALALASGALPAIQIVSPVTGSLLGLDLIDAAQAQESGRKYINVASRLLAGDAA